MLTTKLGFAFALAALFLSACGPSAVPRKPVRYGLVASPTVEVVAENPPLDATPGKPFTPPPPAKPLPLARNQKGRVQLGTLVGSWQRALELGAFRVRVKDGGPDELYGILYLGSVPVNVQGPAADSYRIQLPQSQLEKAHRGERTVVLEEVLLPVPTKEGNTEATWILWLSKEPFA